jgi:hypothetical protein
MRLALVGADSETLDLVRWAVFAGGHDLVAAFDVGPMAGDVTAINSNVRLDEDWESVLLGTLADAVIVARGQAGAAAATGIPDEERRAEQLRKLAQAAVPMLVVCPACEAIVGFEIEMIRRDSGGVIVPFVPLARSEPVRELVDLVSYGDSSPIGSVEQVVFERGLVDRSRASVLTAFARDAAVLRQVVGTLRTISASGPAPVAGRDPLGPKPKEPASLANLGVHVSGDEGLAARWSVIPSHSGQHASITLIGQQATAVLHMPEQGNWRMDVAGSEQRTKSFAANQDHERALWQLSHAHEPEFRDDQAWLHACRDQEAAEAIDRSLARGRTIELFNEQHTEEDSFKGVMAMGGCLLLLGALGVVFVATIVEGLRLPLRDWAAWRYWPVYLLVPIGVFLMLQLLQLVVKKEPPDLRQLVGHEEPGN